MTSAALIRLARCRHPRRLIAFGFGSSTIQVCAECGSHRVAPNNEQSYGSWTRPKLVSDLIAEKKGKGK